MGVEPTWEGMLPTSVLKTVRRTSERTTSVILFFGILRGLLPDFNKKLSFKLFDVEKCLSVANGDVLFLG